MSRDSRDSSDRYEQYETLFDPTQSDRQGRRQRKPKAPGAPRKPETRLSAPIEDAIGSEGGFKTTYQPSRYEAGWLLASLRTFYDLSLITDVLAIVKGGKEANVYRCRAHPATGHALLAAKVYRPRMFRSLSNDAMYREGRAVLTGEGSAVKASDHRTMRAIGKKTAFGEQVAHTSWLMHEFTTLAQLHALGAAVPAPFASADNAILMGYVGDEHIAAPPLSEIRLVPDEAAAAFESIVGNIALMLQHGLIHGDLSAYNILYWEGVATIIDLPQVSQLQANRSARFILERDVTRVCDYFERQGVATDAPALTERLWHRYAANVSHDEDFEEDF